MKQYYIHHWFYIYDVFQSEVLLHTEEESFMFSFIFELCFIFLLVLYFGSTYHP